MSIHSIKRKGGEVFIVRNRDADGVNRSRAFATREEAEEYQAAVYRAKARRRDESLARDLNRF